VGDYVKMALRAISRVPWDELNYPMRELRLFYLDDELSTSVVEESY
jgi:hypothetical protein